MSLEQVAGRRGVRVAGRRGVPVAGRRGVPVARRRGVPVALTLAALVLAALVLSPLSGWAPPARAAAAQTYPLPASGTVTFTGHGYGPGVGLSQWGAQGAAEQQRSWRQIVAFYYPRASVAAVADSTLRVLLTAAGPTELDLAPTSGLTATDGHTGAHVTPATSGVSRVRALPVTGGLVVQQLGSGANAGWKTLVFSNGHSTVAGPVTFSAGSTELELLGAPGQGGELYRGALQAVPVSGGLEAVDVLGLEAYLDGVVPHESIPSWQPAALQAQAVAARSYALYRAAEREAAGLPWDVTDTTADQVFEGPAAVSPTGTVTAQDSASTTAAVAATAGEVLEQGGAPIAAEYGASDGGWTVADPWVDYLPAEADPYDAVPGEGVHSWAVTVPVGQIAALTGLARATALEVSSRDGNGAWGGRVLALSVQGTAPDGAASSVSIDPGAFSAGLGLLDTWWTLPQTQASSVDALSVAPALYTHPGPGTAVLTATMTNDGTAPWPLSALRLVPAADAGRQPALSPTAAPAAVDLTTTAATSAAPGDRVRVSLVVSAAGLAPGSYPAGYQLALGTGAPFGAVAGWTLRVVATVLAATEVGTPTALRLSPTGRVAETLSFRNTGNVSWPSGGLLRLGTADPRGRTDPLAGPGWINPRRVGPLLAPAGSSVTAPGAVATITLVLSGNDHPAGALTEAYQLLWEGASWFGPVVSVPVTVS